MLAVLPDFDIIPAILLNQEGIENHHTTLMHRPLVVLPAAALAALTLGGSAWALVAFLCVAWHYLHDTPPLSPGGIAWLWPIDRRFMSLYGAQEPHPGALKHEEWIKACWLRPTLRSTSEIGIGLVALILAVIIALR